MMLPAVMPLAVGAVMPTTRPALLPETPPPALPKVVTVAEFVVVESIVLIGETPKFT